MKYLPCLLLVCITTLGWCERAGAQDLGAHKDLPTQVRSIFLAKCSECHGRSLSRPRAGLYLHELRQVASSPEWVAPFEPDKSYLWTLVRNDDMPAKGAKAGLLSPKEKETIRAWIAAGALVPSSQTSPVPVMAPQDGSGTAPSVSESTSQPLRDRLLAWLGRFHVLVLHFPIALLLTAALVEVLAAFRGSRAADATVRTCVLLGAVGALVTVLLGWLHADFGGYGGTASGLITLHRWLGTVAGAWLMATVLLSEHDSRRGRRSLPFRVLLWLGAALVGVTAHLGGLLVHGSSFFDWS